MGEVVSFPHSDPIEPQERRTFDTVVDDLRSKNVTVLLAVGINPEGEAVFTSTTFDPLVLRRLALLAGDAVECLTDTISDTRIQDILKENDNGDSGQPSSE